MLDLRMYKKLVKQFQEGCGTITSMNMNRWTILTAEILKVSTPSPKENKTKQKNTNKTQAIESQQDVWSSNGESLPKCRIFGKESDQSDQIYNIFNIVGEELKQ